MIGIFANVLAIVVGTSIGCIFKRGIKPQYEGALFDAMGFAALGLGLHTMVKNMELSHYPILFILSLALGSLAGNVFQVDARFQGFIGKHTKSNLGEGLSTGILLYCIGTLSILGPVMSALYGDHTFLFTNATLDFVTSMIFGSTYGGGMILAAPVLFLWQGGIYCTAYFLSGSFFSPELMTELSIVGGVLIAASGISILKIKDCKTMNLLPALLVPMIFFLVKQFLGL